MKHLISIKQCIIIAMFVIALFCSNLQAQTLADAIKLSQSERYEDADDMFSTLVKQSNVSAETYFYYGKNVIDMYLADPYSNSANSVITQASEIFRKGIAADSANALNNIGLGMIVLFQKNDTTLADTYFKIAEAQFPKKKKAYTEYHVNLLIELGDAQLYAKTPRFEKAIAYLRTAESVAPKNTEIFITLGDIYMAIPDVNSAILNYNRAQYINPNLTSAIVKIGRLYLRSRNLTDSREAFEKAIKIDSTYAPAYKGLGEMYSMGGAYASSKSNFKKYLDLLGNNIPAQVSYLNALFRAKDYVEVYNNVDNILAVDQSRNYIYRLAAYSSYEKRPADYEKGLNYMETFFSKTTEDKIITKDYAYYGRLLIKVKKDSAMIDKGFEVLQKAYSLDSTDATILSDITINAYFLKRYELAVNMINLKIDKGLAQPEDYMYLGKSYYQLGLYTKADSTFNKVAEMNPDNVQAYLWMANSASKQDPKSELGLAKPKFETLIEKASVDKEKYSRELIQAYSYLSSYYLITAKDYANVDACAEKILQLDPKSTNAYIFLAISAIQRKNYNGAKNYYSKILEFDPNNANAKKGVDDMNKYMKRAQQAQQAQ